MTIEQKAKAYDQALERAREVHRNEDDKASTMEFLFPELAEAADEKIMGDIISLVNEFWERIGSINPEYSSRSRMIAWLEKQGKRDARYKNLDELLGADTIYQMAMNDAMVEEAKTKAMNALSELAIGELLGIEKQGQKPAWSEEDEEICQNILECLRNGWRKLPTDILKYESWLESIEQRMKGE